MPEIARSRLVSTDILVSEVGFGCWQLGGKGWGHVSQREIVNTIEAATERGVNLFDTAPVYGFGLSEELLGKTLARCGDDCVIVSKGGLVWDASRRVEHDARPDSLRRQLEASLKRLGRDRLDAYVLHWPDPQVPIDESLASLESFRCEGLIRCWGVSNLPLPAVETCLKSSSELSFLQLPLNVLNAHPEEHQEVARDGAALLSLSTRHGLGVLAFDVLARGFLGRQGRPGPPVGRKDLRRRDWRFSEDNASLLEERDRLARCADRQNAPLTALAIRATLERPGVTACLVGMKSREQLEQNLRFGELELPEEFRPHPT